MIDYPWLIRNGGLLISLIAIGSAIALLLIGRWEKRNSKGRMK